MTIDRHWHWDHDETPFSDLVGVTLTKIEDATDRIIFHAGPDWRYEMYHNQDCCESVQVEDVTGDWEDLIGVPILLAEVESNSKDLEEDGGYGSETWTFYKLGTIEGYVTIRWKGESNGYYSESVSFYKKSTKEAA